MTRITILNEKNDFFYDVQNEYFSISREEKKTDFTIDFTPEDLKCIDRIKETYKLASTNIKSIKLPPTSLLIFKGPSYFDGHAMRVRNQVYTFIDISAYSEYLKNKQFSFDVFFFHELVHGSHYSLNLEFSPENITQSDERYLYKTIVEGIAVYISSKIYSNKDYFWFNFIDSNLSSKWLSNMKKNHENDIFSLISNNFSEEQKINLLGMKEFSDEFIVNGRRAYYIGYKILTDYFSNKDPLEILKLKHNEILEAIS